MKVNKWTLGLAAVGLVSLPTLVQAEEKASPVTTALSSTMISGYVDTSAHWDLGTGNANPPGYIYNSGKQDGFNLNKVKVRIEKPLDESQWAAGYKVDLLFGPDANVFGSQVGSRGDFAIQQAYVALRAPVLNGLDVKVGVFDSIIGYESHDNVNNPNYTRSYGTTIEPHTHTGVLATYQFSEMVSAAVGIANTLGPTINARAPRAESYKAYMASLAFTAPESMGFLKGSTLYAGVVNGFNSGAFNPTTGQTSGSQSSWYLGGTLATPVTNLKVGASYDYAARDEALLGFGAKEDGEGYQQSVAGYLSFQATEKLSLHGRGEYFWQDRDLGVPGLPSKVFAATGTVQYDLWKNVLSRVELRWDHAADGSQAYGGVGTFSAPTKKNSYLLAANIVYKF